MASNFRVEPVRDADMPRCMEILIQAFGSVPSEKISTGPSTPANLQAVSERHLRAHREHAASFPSVPAAINCIYTDPETGEEHIVGFAEWFVYDRPRTEEEYRTWNYLQNVSWVEDDEDREFYRSLMRPMLETRWRVMGGRPYAILMYLCVDEEFRRRGVGKMCVRWGLDRCKELGVPAYLTPSEEGLKLYKQMGYKIVDSYQQGDAKFPVMLWEPSEQE